ncbi:MAG: phosphohydrolase [Erysipelotrichaceae bacterium]|nr:phosphohydrolase [Erysipelotrichaceae bacterium]
MTIARDYITDDPIAVLLRYGSDILRNPKYLKLKEYKQHQRSTTYDHCVAVTLSALKTAKKRHFKVNASILVRGCLLHDYFLYDCHEKGHPKHHWFLHGIHAAMNAMHDFGINEVEADMIANHMWPLHPLRFPIHPEGWLLVYSDKKEAFKDAFGKKRLKEREKLKAIETR